MRERIGEARRNAVESLEVENGVAGEGVEGGTSLEIIS